MRAVFEESNRRGATVGSIFRRCSFGKTLLTAQNSRVTRVVDLPCNGTSLNVPWNFSRCEFDDISGWADAADERLRAQGVVLKQYRYQVYLVPPGACTFTGLGYIGCPHDGSFDCRPWIGGDFWATSQLLAHELGHNLELAHSGSAGSQEGRYSSTNMMIPLA